MMTDINDLRARLIRNLEEEILQEFERPIVETEFGFSVDGGYNDLKNFEVANELGINYIVDSENITHPFDPQNWSKIIMTIKIYGLHVLQFKWDKKAEINNEDLTLEELSLIKVEYVIS